MSEDHKPCYAPVFGPSSGLACFLIYIAIVVAIVILIVALLFTFGSAEVLCRIRQLIFRLKYCGVGNSDREIDLAFSLEDWLECHPEIRGAIRWEAADGLLGYADWSDAQKADLAAAFDRAQIERDGGLDVPAEASAVYVEGAAITSMEYPAEIAWNLYTATVAQCLVCEVRSWVPWSLMDHPTQLPELLASPALFTHFSSDGGERYRAFGYAPTSYGLVTLGDPARVFERIQSLGLVGATPEETVEAMVDWARSNMLHYLGFMRPENALDHWQYLGFPPIETILEGTTRTSDNNFAHWTSGCWGTTGFFRAVLRSANLAVVRLAGCGHSLPSFLATENFLTHGDDPYNQRSKWEPTMPIADILQPIANYASWFGDTVSCDGGGNVGRGVIEALKIHLPHPLLKLHCDDIAAGRAHADSEVFAVFGSYFSVVELEADNLWSRMDSAIAALGGCDSIP